MSNPTFTLIQSSWLGNVCQMHKAPWRFKRSSESQYTPQGYSGYKSGVAGFVVFFLLMILFKPHRLNNLIPHQ